MSEPAPSHPTAIERAVESRGTSNDTVLYEIVGEYVTQLAPRGRTLARRGSLGLDGWHDRCAMGSYNLIAQRFGFQFCPL